MKNLFASSVVLLSLGLSSSARIGETMEEAVKRYGRVIRHETTDGADIYTFVKNGFHILAHFHNGKIDRIVYNSESREKLTEEEIATFLKVNNGGHPMNEDLPYVWVGKHVAATYSKWSRGGWHLDIKNRAFWHRHLVAKKVPERVNLEGF